MEWELSQPREAIIISDLLKEQKVRVGKEGEAKGIKREIGRASCRERV